MKHTLEINCNGQHNSRVKAVKAKTDIYSETQHLMISMWVNDNGRKLQDNATGRIRIVTG